jgi:uncharacterized protein involved in exopolysaccharide biosynthesis/Mrp family chromosome partitioning ATPase
MVGPHSAPAQSTEGSLQPGEFLATIANAKLRILGFFSLALVAALAVLSTMRPSYQATATVLLNQQSDGSVSFQDEGSTGQPRRVEDELSILLSRPVAESTAASTSWEASPRTIFRSTQPDSIGPGGLEQLGLEVLVEPDDLRTLAGMKRRVSGRKQAIHRLHVRVEKSDPASPNQVRIRFLGEGKVEVSEPSFFGNFDRNVSGPFEYTPGGTLDYAGLTLRLEAVGDFAGKSYVVMRQTPESAVRRLMENTRAQIARRDSGVIQVTVTDSDPRRAAETANALCTNYILRSLDLQQMQAEKTASFLQAQIAGQRELLAAAEAEVVAVRNAHPETIDLSASASSLINQMSLLEVNHAKTSLAKESLEQAISAIADGGLSGLARLDRNLPDLASKTYIDEISRLRAEAELLDRQNGGQYQAQLQAQITRLRTEAEEAQMSLETMYSVVEALGEGNLAAAVQVDGGDDHTIINSATARLLAQLVELDGKIAMAKGVKTKDHPEVLDLVESREALIVRTHQHFESLVHALERKTKTLATLKTTYEELLAALPGEERATIDAAVASLLEGVQENLKIQVQGTSTQLESLREQIRQLETELAELSKQENLIAGPLRRRQTHTKLLGFLEGTLQEVGIDKADEAPVASLVGPAAPPHSRHSPRVALTLLFCALMGIILGVGLTFASEAVRDTLRDESGAEQAIGLPSIGVLPDRGSRSSVFELLDGPLKEPIRTIKANLVHALDNGGPVRTLAVVSCNPKEGRSLTNLGMAAALCTPSARVLIIDGDRHSPALHSILGLRAAPGLNEVLGGDALLHEVVQPTPWEGLELLAAGRASNGDRDAQASLASLITKSQAEYDLIIIDLPPLVESADAHSLAPVIDAFVLLVREGSGNVKDTCSLARRFAQSGAALVGMVFNAAPVRKRLRLH